MAFRKTNEELILPGLDDFIEKPSQDCSEEEIKNGVSKVLFVLSKNPIAIMNTIANHPYIPATFLLEDLAEKMAEQQCKEKLSILFDKCLNDLVEACIYNSSDLKRCAQIAPEYVDKVIQNVLSHEHCIKRILEADKNPEETLQQITKDYPLFREQFSECYNKILSAKSILKH